ncbi:MAG: hypothetical protein HYY95_27690 [Candidatus Rokubacteria bacterium]|nr:hypothetical protein [Candidatus Rokubacteria bacterium]MBI3109312.1 hypothetical protein [Candidatus Rokubacteria bacterium]
MARESKHRRRKRAPARPIDRIAELDDMANQIASNARRVRVEGGFTPAEKKRVAAEIVELHGKTYDKTKNPLLVWRAYLECRAAKRPAPKWVLSYLDRVARRFWLWSMNGGARPPSDVSVAIAEALEMKRPGRGGRGNIFTRFSDSKNVGLSIAVSHRLRDGDKLYVAIEAVAAEKNLGRATVWRAWRKYPPAR